MNIAFGLVLTSRIHPYSSFIHVADMIPFDQMENALGLLGGLDELDQASEDFERRYVKDAIDNIRSNLTRDEKKKAPTADTLDQDWCLD